MTTTSTAIQYFDIMNLKWMKMWYASDRQSKAKKNEQKKEREKKVAEEDIEIAQIKRCPRWR